MGDPLQRWKRAQWPVDMSDTCRAAVQGSWSLGRGCWGLQPSLPCLPQPTVFCHSISITLRLLEGSEGLSITGPWDQNLKYVFFWGGGHT